MHNKRKGTKFTAQLLFLAMLLNLLLPVMAFASPMGPEVATGTGVLNELLTESQGDNEAESGSEIPTQPELGSPEESSPEQESPEPDSPELGKPELEDPEEDEPGLPPEGTEQAQVNAIISVETRTINGQDLLPATSVMVDKGTTVAQLLSKVCLDNEIVLDTNGSWITAIGGIATDGALYHEWSGWMFMTNGVFGNEMADQQVVADGDEIRFVFCISDDYDGRSDLAFAEDYCNLMALVLEAAELEQGDYTDEQWALVEQFTEEAMACLSAIDEYDSPTKADGLPGYILDHDISSTGEIKQGIRALADNLARAIAKEDVYVPVESITLNKTEVNLLVGGEYQLKATVSPSNATNQELTWEIVYNFNDALNSDVSNGLIRALKPTTTPVSVKVTCQDFIDNNIGPSTVKITVKEPSLAQTNAAEAMDAGGDWLKEQNGNFSTRTLNSDFDAFILARMDKMDGTDSKNYYKGLYDYVAANKKDLTNSNKPLGKVSTWSKIILATNALGYDPSNVAGVDFVDLLLNYDVKGYVDAAMCSNMLFALDSKDYETTSYSRGDLVNALLSFQDPTTGGFSAWGSVDPDTTGEALIALSAYRDLPGVEKAVAAALDYLSKGQTDQGYYISWGSNSPWSTGRVLMGVAGLGIDPLGSDASSKLFQKSGGNLISGILQFVTSDYGFNSNPNGAGDQSATRDCLMGLMAYHRLINEQDGLFDLTNCAPEMVNLEVALEEASAIKADGYTKASFGRLGKAITAGEEVVQGDINGKVTQSINELKAAIANLKKEVIIGSGGQIPESDEKQGIAVDENTPIDVVVPKGNDVYLEITDGATLPAIKADSTINNSTVVLAIPSGTMAKGTETIQLPQALDGKAIVTQLNQAVGKNTTVEQYFQVGANESITFTEYVTLTFSGLGESQGAYVDASGVIDTIPKVAGDAQGTGDEYCYSNGSDLVVKTKHFTEFIAYSLSSTGDGGSDGEATDVTVIVDASKAGAKGFPTIETTMPHFDGMTAMWALKNTVNEVEEDGTYVTGIKGLEEFDCGPKSGWMYSVNGVFPGYTANSYSLKAGDTLTWAYTLDMGNDVGGGGGATTEEETTTIDPVVLSKMKETVTAASAKTKQVLLAQKELTAWEAFALVQSGEKLDSSYYQALEAEVKAVKGNFRKVTDTEKMILSVTALGHDATNVGGYNLVEAIYNHENLKKQGNNGLIFALLALDSNDYQVPKDAVWTQGKLVNEILAQQHEDGGFALAEGLASDVDITAMAIQALANYQAQPKVKVAINSALVFLSKAQQDDGGFLSQGVKNSESVTQVILALTTLGINPLSDQRFIKGEQDLLGNLLSFQLKDGSFEHIKGQGSNGMATEQGMLALVSLERLLNGQPHIFKKSQVAIAPIAPKKAQTAFKDAEAIASWAKADVLDAGSKGLVAGFADGNFKPKQAVTRAEFLSILGRGLGWDTTGAQGGHFADVDDQAWYGPMVNTAYNKGLIKGNEQGLFKGSEAITREEMMVMIYQAKGLSPSENMTFTDQAEIASWAIDAINAGYAQGYLLGNEGAIDPKGQVTREMAAVVALRVVGN